MTSAILSSEFVVCLNKFGAFGRQGVPAALPGHLMGDKHDSFAWQPAY